VIAVAKALGVAGLVLNMTGAICIWWIVPHGSSMHYGQPIPVPFRPPAKIANIVGWPLLILGFALQLVATVLAP
jgi:hypothetical protein